MSQRIYNFSLLTAGFLSSTMDFSFELYFVVLHPFTNSSSWTLPPRSTLFYGFIVPSLCRVVECNPLKKTDRKGLLGSKKYYSSPRICGIDYIAIDNLTLST